MQMSTRRQSPNARISNCCASDLEFLLFQNTMCCVQDKVTASRVQMFPYQKQNRKRNIPLCVQDEVTAARQRALLTGSLVLAGGIFLFGLVLALLVGWRLSAPLLKLAAGADALPVGPCSRAFC